MPLHIGAHTIGSGGIHMAARRAGRSGMNALQVFTAVPKFYNDNTSMKPERVAQFREALKTAGIAPEQVIVHAGYVLNIATHDAEKWPRASAALTRELERSTAIGARGVCFHPGSSGGNDRELSLANVARAMAAALETVEGSTRLLVENTAGAGNTVGKTAKEIGTILKALPKSLRGRAGYGLDTCHLFSSGFELTRSREYLAEVLDEFEAETGEPPSFFHLNDSEGDLGSNRDRHVLIGEGRIGAEPFRWLINDRRAREVPLILETPQENPEIAPDDDSPDPLDVRMVGLLRSMAETG